MGSFKAVQTGGKGKKAHGGGGGGGVVGWLVTGEGCRERGSEEAHCKLEGGSVRMTRGEAKIEAQKRAAEKNEKPKGSQIEARNAGLKTVCSVCKAPLANYKQLVDHFGSKHPKEAVPAGPSS